MAIPAAAAGPDSRCLPYSPRRRARRVLLRTATGNPRMTVTQPAPPARRQPRRGGGRHRLTNEQALQSTSTRRGRRPSARQPAAAKQYTARHSADPADARLKQSGRLLIRSARSPLGVSCSFCFFPLPAAPQTLPLCRPWLQLCAACPSVSLFTLPSSSLLLEPPPSLGPSRRGVAPRR